jgi:hypothetical protein
LHYNYGFSGDYAPNFLPSLARLLALADTAQRCRGDAVMARRMLGLLTPVRVAETIYVLERYAS